MMYHANMTGRDSKLYYLPAPKLGEHAHSLDFEPSPEIKSMIASLHEHPSKVSKNSWRRLAGVALRSTACVQVHNVHGAYMVNMPDGQREVGDPESGLFHRGAIEKMVSNDNKYPLHARTQFDLREDALYMRFTATMPEEDAPMFADHEEFLTAPDSHKLSLQLKMARRVLRSDEDGLEDALEKIRKSLGADHPAHANRDVPVNSDRFYAKVTSLGMRANYSV